MGPTGDLDLSAAAAAGTAGVPGGSSGDDRPPEDIGFSFTKPQEPGPSSEGASGPVGIAGTPGGSSGDDRPTEEIGFNFTEPGLPISPKPLSEGASEAVSIAGTPGGDDTPTETIGIGFAEVPILHPSADAASLDAVAADGFLLATGEDGASDLLDFSGIDTGGREAPDEALSFEFPAAGQPDAAGDDAFSAAVGSGPDRTGDGIADLVTAPKVSLDDFLA